MPSLRNRVRDGTRAAHASLEATAVMRRVASGVLSTAEYRHYLSVQLSLHAPLEVALARWLPADLADLRLRKSEWLTADLRALGGAVDRAPVEPMDIRSPAEAMGVLYVLEGGTLGLQVVRKRLVAGGHAAMGAGRFLRGYGADTARHWQAFVVALDAVAPSHWPQATCAACATFSAFHTVFEAASAEASG